MNYKRIGDYIELVDERNKELKVNTLLGLSISKQFIPSVANTIGTNMKNYKVIRKNQFACSVMQVRRDGKMPVALLKDFDKAIISQAYPVFQVIDESELLPDYLMMWFTRSEFDREATFHAVGGVRGSLEWEDFLDFKLPIPSIEKQNQIVAEYNTVTNRIQLNEKINTNLEATAQALYKHWFVDFEFPAHLSGPLSGAEGYKSSGGEMVYNEELDKDIPIGWSVENLTYVLKIFGGGTPKTTVSNYWSGQIPFFTPKDIGSSFYSIETEKNLTEEGLKNCSSKLYPRNTIFITARGTVGAINLTGKKMAMNQSCYAFREINSSNYYGHQLALRSMEELTEEATGAVFKALVTKDFDGKRIICPENNIRKNYDQIISPLYSNILLNTEQSQTLQELQSLLLAKMTQQETKAQAV